jgi:glycosyltransferase involved in cell wall biosynthesis
MKVFEYMAAGLPVVVTSAGQLSEIITDECNGLLCEAGNTQALADALLCLKRDPALRMRLGRAARRKILVDHTWRSVASRVLTFSDEQLPSTVGRLAHVAP